MSISISLFKYKQRKYVFPDKLYVVNGGPQPWYRGRIRKIHIDSNTEEQVCEIFAIDFGFLEHAVPITRLRLMPEKLKRVCALAEKHSMSHISPTNTFWGQDCKKTVDEILAMY